MKKLTTWLLVLLFFIGLIPTFIPVVKASSSTWYVAKTGSDTTGDGSIGNPFASLRKAINRSSNGDTIYMRGGNYNKIYPPTTGIKINRSGTGTQPFTIMSYPGERAVINGNGYTLSAGNGLLETYTSTYYNNITIRDLTIENSSWDGIKVSGDTTGVCKDISIINCTFNNMSYHAIYFYTSDASMGGYIENVTVRDCHFWKSQTSLSMGECITFVGCNHAYFYNNTVTWGRKILVCFGDGTKNGLIYNNNLRINDSQTAQAIYLDTSSENGKTLHNVSIYNNYIWGCTTATVLTGCAIGINGEITGGKLDNISIYNNVINVGCDNIVDPTNNFYHGIELCDSSAHNSTMTDITVKYNTICIALGYGRPFMSGQYRRNLKNVVVANNIFITNESRMTTYQVSVTRFNITDGCILMYNNLYYSTHGTTNKGVWNGVANVSEASAVIDSPQFVDRVAGNFHLNATSPAINAASSSNIVSTDFDEVIRPQGAGYDIGAYEYQNSEGDTTSPVISQVGVASSNPLDTQAGYGWENFTAMVTDNVAVSSVLLKITNPDTSTTNVPMSKKISTTTFYSNQSLNLEGNYSYVIQATDTNNNVALSSSYKFSLPPNGDINNDGHYTVLDLVLVSNHYNQTGGHGWIREDVDNNGVVKVLDIVIVSDHYGEVWWV